MDNHQSKSELRAKFLAHRRSLTPDSVSRSAYQMLDQFSKTFCLPPPFKTIMSYAPINNEASPLPIVNALLGDGIRVALPQTDVENLKIIPREIQSIDNLHPGHWQIPEPPAESPIVPIAEIELCMIPGVAFDLQGYRLGYGGGYYDRFLCDLSTDCLKVALAFEWQIVNKIQFDVWDIAVDGIITESRYISINDR